MLGVNFEGWKFRLSQKERTNRLCYYLPYNFLIGKEDEGIVFLKPGALMRTYSFVCPDLGSSSAESVAAISRCFNESIKRLGSGWAAHFEVRREKTTRYPGCEWDNALGYLMDSRRRDNFKNKAEHFLNYFFLTFTYEVSPDIVTKGKGFLYKKDEDDGDDYYKMENISKEIQFFRDRTEEVVSYIRAHIAVNALNDGEVVTYIKSSISTRWRATKAPKIPIFFDQFITDEDVQTGSCMKVGEHWCPVVEVRDFPSATYPAVFDMLNHASVEYRWVTRWISMDKQISAKLIEKYQKRFNNSRKSWGQVFVETAGNISTDRVDPAAIAFEEDTNEAKVSLSNDVVSFGYYTSCVEVWDKNYNVAQDKARYISTLINSCGFGAKSAGLNSFQAWLGMMPGNVYANNHKTLLSSGNLAHIIPLSSCWTGDFYNRWTDEHFGCQAPLLTASSYGSPFFLQLNVGDVFHSFIFGPAGAGKSTFLCLLETQFLKYPGANIIVLDKDKTARGVCMAAGGAYLEPGADATAFQPLRELETEEQLTWACEFIELCLTEQGMTVTARQTEAIRTALTQLRDTKEVERRDITTFQLYCQDEDVCDTIQPYTLDGQYGRIFDAHGESVIDNRFLMIEMGILMQMGSSCVTPALMYIFRMIESRFAAPNDENGKSTLLVLDEAWVFLDNPYFAARIEEWLLTLRKKRVAVVFATQEVSKAANSSLSTTIASQCQTKFYLADPSASTELVKQYYKKFDLSDSEIEALSLARMKRDYLYKSANGVRMFQLELDGFQLALLNPQKAVLDALEKKYGRNSGKELAVEILEKQGFDTSQYMSRYGAQGE